ncbi:hypothetical protein DPEC_G00309610 [Dallia pectoralis]|uniref:Uncharacterized protein n=1 Tax=Dallia pectoralis TaxID=75939 RepID=A0ACC2FF21_DALPE|nr:hypothetical protein DPEC_G00309610 [Dallia pectoralis]
MKRARGKMKETNEKRNARIAFRQSIKGACQSRFLSAARRRRSQTRQLFRHVRLRDRRSRRGSRPRCVCHHQGRPGQMHKGGRRLQGPREGVCSLCEKCSGGVVSMGGTLPNESTALSPQQFPAFPSAKEHKHWTE